MGFSYFYFKGVEKEKILKFILSELLILEDELWPSNIKDEL